MVNHNETNKNQQYYEIEISQVYLPILIHDPLLSPQLQRKTNSISE